MALADLKIINQSSWIASGGSFKTLPSIAIATHRIGILWTESRYKRNCFTMPYTGISLNYWRLFKIITKFLFLSIILWKVNLYVHFYDTFWNSRAFIQSRIGEHLWILRWETWCEIVCLVYYFSKWPRTSWCESLRNNYLEHWILAWFKGETYKPFSERK